MILPHKARISRKDELAEIRMGGYADPVSVGCDEREGEGDVRLDVPYNVSSYTSLQ